MHNGEIAKIDYLHYHVVILSFSVFRVFTGQIYYEVLIRLNKNVSNMLMREKCPYSELLWSVFSRIRTKYELPISPDSVRMQENAYQNNFEYGHYLDSVLHPCKQFFAQTFCIYLTVSNIST